MNEIPQEYTKEEVVKTTEQKMLNELDKFVYSNIGKGTIFKLREILEEFQPIMMIIHASTRGHKILVKLQTYDFPENEDTPAETRVGIEFIKMLD